MALRRRREADGCPIAFAGERVWLTYLAQASSLGNTCSGGRSLRDCGGSHRRIKEAKRLLGIYVVTSCNNSLSSLDLKRYREHPSHLFPPGQEIAMSRISLAALTLLTISGAVA